jgi:hypothetical protein
LEIGVFGSARAMKTAVEKAVEIRLRQCKRSDLTRAVTGEHVLAKPFLFNNFLGCLSF